ncbi:MAG: hypothetical protein LEGION0398_MBIBDBAK_00241 [Legionellaceae bacterium]
MNTNERYSRHLEKAKAYLNNQHYYKRSLLVLLKKTTKKAG